MTDRKSLKVGVWQGAGPEPGYFWTVAVLQIARAEAVETVGNAGYLHFAMQVKAIAREEDPTHSDEVDVRTVGDVHEIRDGGGVCGNINVRVFFGLDHHRRTIAVIGAIKKQNNGPTPQGDKITMHRRWRAYQNGEYGFLV